MSATPISVLVGDGPVRFRNAHKIEGTLGRVWECATSPEHVQKFFGMTLDSPLTQSGRKCIQWNYGAETLLDVVSAEPNRIVMQWNSGDGDYRTTIELTAEQMEDKTIVAITESGWNMTQPGSDAAMENCGGWAAFLARLRFYVEHGVVSEVLHEPC